VKRSEAFRLVGDRCKVNGAPLSIVGHTLKSIEVADYSRSSNLAGEYLGRGTTVNSFLPIRCTGDCGTVLKFTRRYGN
jgi:hypothetical protein